jgi:(p)ppGpp synthase/HD superfamily hydrolase
LNIIRHDTRPSDVLSPLVELATELSAQWHDGTYRKSRWRNEPFETPGSEFLGVPVMAHVTCVAMMVQREGWDDVTVAAAFLHDVIEDANRFGSTLTAQDLASTIGSEVTSRVLEVTEEKYDTGGKPRSWRPRKVDYLERLTTASDGAVAVSVADKIHNCWTMNRSMSNGMNIFVSDQNRAALHAGPAEQIWYFREVLSIVEERSNPLLERLKVRLREELERFEELSAKFTP